MNILQRKTIHKSPRLHQGKALTPKLIVIHGDAGKTDLGTITWITDPASGVSYHFLVGRDGTVYQFVSEKEKAWHAGVSKWKGMGIGNSVNATSLGVAFANDGEEPYQSVQYKQGAELVARLMKRHGIVMENVVGHKDVSPGRKSDPWPHFDWATFKKLVGTHL